MSPPEEAQNDFARGPVWAYGAPLLSPALALLTGIGLGPALPAVGLPAAMLAAIGVTLAVLARWRWLAIVALCAPMLLVGIVRAQRAALLAPDDVTLHLGEFVEVQGFVAGEPDVRDRVQLLRVRVTQLRSLGRRGGSWAPVSGAVQVRTASATPFAYGDVVDIRGKLTAPPQIAGFDYADYLARQGVRAVLTYPRVTLLGRQAGDPLHGAAFALQNGVERALAETLPEPERSLQRAVLIGTRSAAFSTLTPDFIRTGMIHIIATSGFKVAIVGNSALGLFLPLLGRRKAAWPALATVALYVLVTGSTPAGERAGLMWALAVGALLTGRPSASLQGLALVAAAMALVDPLVIGDTGFQMSVAATAGILLFEPRLAGLLRRWPGWLAGPISMTLAAQIGALPVTMVGFNQVSLIAPLSNLLCLPLLPLQMLCGTLLVLAQTVSPSLGYLVGVVSYVPLAAMIVLVHALAQLPFAAVPAPTLGVIIAVLYYAGCAATLGAWRRAAQGRRGTHGPASVAGLLAVSAAALVLAALSVKESVLSAPLRLVAQVDKTGDVLLIQSHDATLVVDTGSSSKALLGLVGEALPPWRRRIDALVLLGAEGAHSGAAAALLDHYRVEQVVTADVAHPSLGLQGFEQRVGPLLLLPVGAAGTLPLGTHGELRTWAVGPPSAVHLAALASFGRLRVLDVAALTIAQQRELVTAGLPDGLTVVVGPPGREGPLAPELLAATHPALVVAGDAVAGSTVIPPTSSLDVTTDGRVVELQ
ncbi:MAG: ComEC/Rec2 family competence protein [Chloroflexi bacterium]|nr:ComEC/Rec2 family competence protein [Chloroflexota bacterium]